MGKAGVNMLVLDMCCWTSLRLYVTDSLDFWNNPPARPLDATCSPLPGPRCSMLKAGPGDGQEGKISWAGEGVYICQEMNGVGVICRTVPNPDYGYCCPSSV